MTNSPAEVVRALLISLGMGTDPASETSWPIFSTGEPDTPDNCITVYDTPGIGDGRSMVDGELFTHYGFQVRVRAITALVGWQKANAIRTAMAQSVSKMRVSVDSSRYYVQCIAKIGNVLPLGRDTGNSRRYLFTLNAVVPIRQIS